MQQHPFQEFFDRPQTQEMLSSLLGNQSFMLIRMKELFPDRWGKILAQFLKITKPSIDLTKFVTRVPDVIISQDPLSVVEENKVNLEYRYDILSPKAIAAESVLTGFMVGGIWGYEAAHLGVNVIKDHADLMHTCLCVAEQYALTGYLDSYPAVKEVIIDYAQRIRRMADNYVGPLQKAPDATVANSSDFNINDLISSLERSLNEKKKNEET